jgi:phage gpG-like protein
MELKLILTKDTLTPELKNILYSFENPRQILLAMGNEFLRETKANFGTNGKYRDGVPWPSLSEEYSKKIGSKQPTDLRTGELKNSIKLGPVKGNFVTVYTDNPYAASIAFGNKKNHLPPRNYWPVKFMGSITYSKLTPEAQRDMFNIITKRFTMASQGALPKLPVTLKPMLPEHGNPFSSPNGKV